MSKVEEFIRIFEMPPAMHPHVDLVVNEQEIDLVVGLDDQTMTRDQIAEMMGLSHTEVEKLLEKAGERRVVISETDNGATTYAAGTFAIRLRPLSMYENWGDVPAEARDAVVDAWTQAYHEKRVPLFDAYKKDPSAFGRLPKQHVLLLDEALEQAEAATVHMVIPCDCRSLVMSCDSPVEICLWFDDMTEYVKDRGKRITREEAKALIVDANRAGLIHTGPRDWRETGGPNSLCNCCSCCCSMFRVGAKYDMIAKWPTAFYIAARDADKCFHCGICVKRCNFDAFHFDGSKIEVKGKKRKAVQFDPEKCWGCGLCATACPEEAIMMQPLPADQIPTAQASSSA